MLWLEGSVASVDTSLYHHQGFRPGRTGFFQTVTMSTGRAWRSNIHLLGDIGTDSGESLNLE
jgi:hypothetical protein